jgi:hypothetical protein
MPTSQHHLPEVTLRGTKGKDMTKSFSPFSEGKAMSKQTRVFNPIYSYLSKEVEGFDSLGGAGR